MRPSCKRMPTKLCMMVEAGADHPGVPAIFRFELLIKLLHCVVSNLHGCHNLYCMHQNLPQIFAETISPTVLCFLTYFRRDPVADELWVILGNNRRNIILDFNMLVKTLWNLVMTTFDNFGCPTSFARSTSCGSFIHQII